MSIAPNSRVSAVKRRGDRIREVMSLPRNGIKRVRLLCVLSLILGIPTFAISFQAGPKRQIELSKPLTIHWRYPSEQTINLSPATDGQNIYVPLSAGSLISLRSNTGELVWRAEVGGELTASPVADERGVYVASVSTSSSSNTSTVLGALRLLGRDTGITLWVCNLPSPPRTALAMNDDSIFGATADGRVYAVKKSSGSVIWNHQLNSSFGSQVALVGSRLYAGAEDGKVYAIDENNGKVIWRYQTQGAVRGRVAVSGGLVYFGSADGFVYAVSEETGLLRWRSRTGASVQAVLGVHEGLIATSLDNFAYLLSLTKGDRLWKRRLSGRISAEPLATSDGVLFTPLAGDKGVVLNLKDGKQLNTLPLGEDNGTAASPIIAGDVLMVTTRQGLLAFSRPQPETTSPMSRK